MASSLPPAPPAPSGANRVLVGCGIGCGLLVLLIAAGTGFAYFKLVKPAVAVFEEIDRTQEDNKAAALALQELNQDPPRFPDDLATVELTDADVDRYVAVRAALDHPAARTLAAVEEVMASFDVSQIAEGNPMALFGMVGGMFGGMRDMERDRSEFLAAARVGITAHAMGPDELRALLEIIEWRFLARPEAMPLALADDERREALNLEWQVRLFEGLLKVASVPASAGSSDTEELEREIEEARERLGELQAKAQGVSALSDATRRLLTSRRAELNPLNPAAIPALAGVDDPEPMWMDALSQIDH